MLKLDLSPTTGAFTITVNDAFSLTSSEYRVGNRSSTSGKLKLSGSAAVSGTDSLGPWRGTRLFWTAPQHQNNAGYLMATTFQQYPGDPAILVFEQSFEQTLSFDDGNPLPPVIEPCFDSLKYADDELPPLTSEGVATLFPSFARSPSSSLPCFAYHGIFPQMRSCTVASYTTTHQGGVPLVLYNSTNPSLPMAVFSQLDSPKAQHSLSEPHLFGMGVKGTVKKIPAGWSQRSILSAGYGIGDGMTSFSLLNKASGSLIACTSSSRL